MPNEAIVAGTFLLFFFLAIAYTCFRKEARALDRPTINAVVACTPAYLLAEALLFWHWFGLVITLVIVFFTGFHCLLAYLLFKIIMPWQFHDMQRLAQPAELQTKTK